MLFVFKLRVLARRVSILAIVALPILISRSWAVEVNPNLTNIWLECIADIDAILDGKYTVTDHMDGRSHEAHFLSFNWRFESLTNTTHLIWSDVVNGDCTHIGMAGWIAPGEEFHIGWTTRPKSNLTKVKRYYATKILDGEHIEVGDLPFVNGYGNYIDHTFNFGLINNVKPARRMVVGDINYKLVAESYPLADLNGDVLTDLIYIGTGDTLGFGDTLVVDISLPEGETNSYVVVAYEIYEQDLPDYKTTIYMQFHPEPKPCCGCTGIPMLSMVLLLVGLVIRKRRVTK